MNDALNNGADDFYNKLKSLPHVSNYFYTTIIQTNFNLLWSRTDFEER